MERVRKDLIEDLALQINWIQDNEAHQFPGWRNTVIAMIDAMEMLRNQEETEGHWIVLRYCANEGVYCSECFTKVFEFTHRPKRKVSRFCPHCGVKMNLDESMEK